MLPPRPPSPRAAARTLLLALTGLTALACTTVPTASPRGGSGAPQTGPGAAPTITPAFGLTWGLVQDVERPTEAFAIPSDLPTGPPGPDTAGHPGNFPGQSILRDVSVAADRLVAVGFTALHGVWTADAWTSGDGLHWTLASIDRRPGSFAEAVTTTADGAIVAVGRSGADPAAWISSDGKTWTATQVGRLAPADLPAEPERMTTVLRTDFGLLAGGSAGPELGAREARLWRSDDGRTWTALGDVEGRSDAEVAGIARGPEGYVALGRLGDGQRSTGSIAWRSANGEAWTRIDDLALAGGIAVAIVATEAGFVAVGSDLEEREAVAWSSSDGATWTRAPSEEARLHFGEKVRMTDVVATAAGLVGVGNFVGVQYGTGTSWLSGDAATWMKAPLQPALGQGEPESVIAWRDRLVIVGSRGAPDNYIPSVWIGPSLP
jgi:hypothetical protein